MREGVRANQLLPKRTVLRPSPSSLQAHADAAAAVSPSSLPPSSMHTRQMPPQQFKVAPSSAPAALRLFCPSLPNEGESSTAAWRRHLLRVVAGALGQKLVSPHSLSHSLPPS